MLTLGCVQCRRGLDCHHEVEGKNIPPTVDDVIICAYCRTVQILDENLRPRRLNDDEREEISELLRGYGLGHGLV